MSIRPAAAMMYNTLPHWSSTPPVELHSHAHTPPPGSDPVWSRTKEMEVFGGAVPVCNRMHAPAQHPSHAHPYEGPVDGYADDIATQGSSLQSGICPILSKPYHHHGRSAPVAQYHTRSNVSHYIYMVMAVQLVCTCVLLYTSNLMERRMTQFLQQTHGRSPALVGQAQLVQGVRGDMRNHTLFSVTGGTNN